MQVKVIEKYEIDIQSNSAKNFIGKDGNKVVIEEKKARRATVVICEAMEFTLPLLLPESFLTPELIKTGDYLDVTCPQLAELKPLLIKNVNRVISGKIKNV